MGAFESLVSGDFFTAVFAPITSIGIGTELIYLLLWTSALGIMFMRTKSWELTVVTMIASSFAVVPLLWGQIQIYMIAFIIAGFTFLLYNIFKSK